MQAVLLLLVEVVGASCFNVVIHVVVLSLQTLTLQSPCVIVALCCILSHLHLALASMVAVK